MDSTKNGMWIIPFKKFDMVRVKSILFFGNIRTKSDNKYTLSTLPNKINNQQQIMLMITLSLSRQTHVFAKFQ